MGPIVGTILQAAIPLVVQEIKNRPTAKPADIAAAVAPKVTLPPAAVNAINDEAPLQSRVVVGSTLALVGGAFLGAAQLVDMIHSGSIDVQMAGGALAAILGAAFALYGRLKSGLAPLFSRKKA